MFIKRLLICITLILVLGAFIGRKAAPVLMYYGFEKRIFKKGNDTAFRPDLWKPYLHTGEIDPKKCVPGTYIKGKVSATLSTLQARSGIQSGQCIMDVSNGGICHKAMFRNDFFRKGTDISLPQNERWISFSFFLPDTGADAWLNDELDELVFQLHNDTVASPQLSLNSHNGLFSVQYRYANADPHRVKHLHQYGIKAWEGSVKKGRWIDWVWHLQFSPLLPNGFLQVWVNQGDGLKQIVDEHHIRMGYPCSQLTTFDIGLYKWPWKCPQTSPVKRRVIYIDEIRIGKSSASLDDMRMSQ